MAERAVDLGFEEDEGPEVEETRKGEAREEYEGEGPETEEVPAAEAAGRGAPLKKTAKMAATVSAENDPAEKPATHRTTAARGGARSAGAGLPKGGGE